MVLPHSHRISRVLCYSGYQQASDNLNYGAVTLFRSPFQMSSSIILCPLSSPNPDQISPIGLASSNFARHYFRNRSFTFFSSGYLDVSVPRVPFIQLCIHCMITLYYQCCVPTFGYLRISVHLQLPVAFRSLSRPSSAPSAKASTICSLQLNLLDLTIDFSQHFCFSIVNFFFVNLLSVNCIFLMKLYFKLYLIHITLFFVILNI